MSTRITYYCLSCYGPNAYIFSVPLRASAAWLKKTLKRRDLVDGTPLRKSQFEMLRRRVAPETEIGWTETLEYFLEGRIESSPMVEQAVCTEPRDRAAVACRASLARGR